MQSRRDFIRTAGASAIGIAPVGRLGAVSLPEAVQQTSPATQPILAPANGRPYRPVATLNGWSLPWRMQDNVKEFHLVAEPVVREFAPGMKANLWGYNGQSPGPTIEAVEGDRVRIFVTNKLPEHTTIHWHGMLVPSGMDGVGGLTQPHIAAGKTFVYEFDLRKSGTFMYHPHADEMVQMAMGLMGMFIVHPRDIRQHAVDRDYVFLLSAYDIDPGSFTPRVNTMLDFNLWTFNSRVFPGIAPIVARTGERIRVRVGNLTMTNHPIHLHGHDFEVTGTDGGWIPKAARWPEVSVDIAVGQMRAFEFTANAGDWALHCHKSHHTMNAMGHDVPTMIGVDQRGVVEKITRLIPDYMAMGARGMAEMGAMEMPLPDNTLPMMSGAGPFGPMEMGGMFTTVKVRDDLKAGDYADPGWYRHPPGTVAREWQGSTPEAVRAQASPADDAPLGRHSPPREEADRPLIGTPPTINPPTWKPPSMNPIASNLTAVMLGLATVIGIRPSEVSAQSQPQSQAPLQAQAGHHPSAHAEAQPLPPQVEAHPSTAPALPGGDSAMSEGVVRKIDRDTGRLTLRHGPIANLDMPQMSMVFRVSDPAMLDGLQPDAKIRFKADRIEGQLTVTHIEPAG